jgi:hypothetical protein
MTKKYKYVGNVSGTVMRTAIKKALEARPDVKRLFIETDGGTKVKFVIHKKDESGIKHDVVVHTMKVKDPEDVREVTREDKLYDDKYPVCASVPAMLGGVQG